MADIDVSSLIFCADSGEYVLDLHCSSEEWMGQKPDKAQAEIPYSMLEYTAAFRKPILEAAVSPAILIAAVLNALEPSGYKLDGVETKTGTVKLAEYSILFRRSTPLSPSRTVALGLDKVVFAAENVDWKEAEPLVEEVSAGLQAILKTAQAEIQSQKLGLAMHVQVKTKLRKEVTAPLLSPLALGLLDGEMKFPGIILIREGAMLVIDGSVGYANGIFVRIVRDHPADLTLDRVAEFLRKDEEELFDVLGLEGML